MGERQRAASPEEMASTSTAVATVSPQVQEVISVFLRLIFSIWYIITYVFVRDKEHISRAR